MRTIRVGGFFSGIGAHHSAIDRIAASRPDVQFKVVFQCEIDEKTARAYDLMHGQIQNLKDVTQVNDIGGGLAVDILYWTPPCQDISLANNGRKGNKAGSGTRSSLAFEIPRILQNTPAEERPKYLVFEEVPAMLFKEYADNFKEIRHALSALGYTHNYGILNACDYGVAQNRRRCFMISKLGAGCPKLPEPVKLTKCLKDYLESEPVDSKYYLSVDKLERLTWCDKPSKDKVRVVAKPSIYGGKYRVVSADGIAPTVITHYHKDSAEGLIAYENKNCGNTQ